MKKLSLIVIAVLLVVSMGMSTFALDFVESVEVKTAPEFQKIEVGGKEYDSVITDGQGKETGITLYDKDNHDDDLLEIDIKSTSEKESAALPEIKSKLENSEKQLKSIYSLNELSKGLGKQINDEIDKFYKGASDKIAIEDLAISDVFDVSLIKNKEQLEELSEGSKITFAFKPSFEEDDFFTVIHNVQGSTWEVVEDVEWTEDDFLKITVDSLGVFCFVVDGTGLPVDPFGPDSPKTGDTKALNYLYAAIGVAFAGAAVFFFVKAKKEKNV